jgi:hypothetical protein
MTVIMEQDSTTAHFVPAALLVLYILEILVHNFLRALPTRTTYKVYMLKTLSRETIVSNVDFVLWSLSNFPLRSPATILLNKQTR